jgi:hypothetical protein
MACAKNLAICVKHNPFPPRVDDTGKAPGGLVGIGSALAF